uniref:hypothetical protein n=1 Tax=Ornithinimicrobium sufpigmenti TaxID=2508882 RepID=UPI0037C54B7B
MNTNAQQDQEVRKAQSVIKLVALTDEAQRIEQERTEAVAEGRAAGLSWSQIARALGVSPQAAHQRYSRTDDPEPDR